MTDEEIEHQREIAWFIDHAVEKWHEVAEEHDIKSCNCFREALAGSLVDEGIFAGYDTLDKILPNGWDYLTEPRRLSNPTVRKPNH